MTSIPSHCVLVPLSNRDDWTIISPEDADLMDNRRWYLNGRYVRYDHKPRKQQWLHRVIMERKLGRPILPGMHVDHINGNPLDNRRENLREVTNLQNQHNKRAQSTSKSGFKGVIYDKSNPNKPWIVRIRVNGERVCLGFFATPEEASFVYDKAALKYFGEYARLNHPVEEVLTWKYPIRLDSRNTSGFRGVSSYGDRWIASILDGKKHQHLGIFTTPEDAARAYDRYAIKLRGTAAILNFPREDYEQHGGWS